MEPTPPTSPAPRPGAGPEPPQLRPDESSTGLDPTLAATLAYLVGPVTGVLFLVVEKRSAFVRFHAAQSTITFLGYFVISIVIGVIPLFGQLLAFFLPFVGLVLWILLMAKAFQGEYFKLPVVGDLAEERSGLPPA